MNKEKAEAVTNYYISALPVYYNITDKSSNLIDPAYTKGIFIGTSTGGTIKPAVSSAIAINRNTVKITF